MMDANERYEALAELYYCRYMQMAPGKDQPMSAPMSDEDRRANSERWLKWIDGLALEDCLVALVYSRTDIEQLRSQLAAAKKDARLNRAVMDYWQARFNVLCDAWRDGNNDAVLEACRKFIRANDEAEAQAKLSETADLRSQLSARESQLEGMQNKLHTKDEEINCAGITSDALQAKLAAYDACLTQVRDEMPAVEKIRAELRELPAWRVLPNIQALVDAIEVFERHEAANRNDIAIHLADKKRLTAANAEYTSRHVELTEAVATRDREIADLQQQLTQVDFAVELLVTARKVNLDTVLKAKEIAAGASPQQPDCGKE